MSELSIYKKYEEATRHYYASDTESLRLVPTISKADVAYDIAHFVKGQLEGITEDYINTTATRIQQRERVFNRANQSSFEEYREAAIQDRLAYIVFNAELRHAAAAPGDFNEDSEKSGAYEMGIGIVVLPPTPPAQPPHFPGYGK